MKQESLPKDADVTALTSKNIISGANLYNGEITGHSTSYKLFDITLNKKGIYLIRYSVKVVAKDPTTTTNAFSLESSGNDAHYFPSGIPNSLPGGYTTTALINAPSDNYVYTRSVALWGCHSNKLTMTVLYANAIKLN